MAQQTADSMDIEQRTGRRSITTLPKPEETKKSCGQAHPRTMLQFAPEYSAAIADSGTVNVKRFPAIIRRLSSDCTDIV